MAPGTKSGIGRIVCAAFVVTLAWLGTAARADELLDRAVSFHIAAAPLANALIDFSTQSGIQVAVADADVAHRNSNGLSGTFPIRAALGLLLRGSGLDFARVGAATVAIRAAPVGAGAPSLAGRSGAEKMPAANSASPDANVTASAASQMPDVTVLAPRPPSEQELAGDSLHQFIVHHATVHYLNTGARGNLAHWRGGRPESICPLTLGLDPGYNAFVTARLRAVAVNVGAPVQSDPHCKDNVRVIFTTDPQSVMNDVVRWASGYFIRRLRFAQMRPLIAYTADHAIQGWYITTHGGGRILNADIGLLGLNLEPVWPQITPNWLADNGDMSGIGVVILVVDRTKVAGYTIGTIADYIAMLTLSVVQTPDHCDPLPSILDVMASSCGTREKPTAITAGDLAFLKALYYRSTGLGSSLTRNEIQDNMTRQFASD